MRISFGVTPTLAFALSLLSTFVLALGMPALGAAQEAAEVWEPVVTAAEADYAAARTALARARAEAAATHLPEGTVLRVRADGLRGLTASVDTSAITPEDIVLPLVSAAEADIERGARALALARLDAARALLPESSTYSVRITELHARAEASSGRELDEPVTAGVVVPAGYVRGVGPEGPREVVVDDEAPPVGEAPVTPGGYHRRSDGELVDFYVMSALAGAGVTTYVFAETGLARSIGGFDEGRVYAVAPVLGGGLFLLVPFALDQIDHGMPAGVPGAFAMGLRFGAALSGLTLGAAQTFGASDAGHFLFLGTLGTTLLFGGVSYGILPHPSQVQMIQNTGLWGGAFGAFLALTIAPRVSDSFSTPAFEPVQVGTGLALAGLGTGIVVGSIMSGLDLQLPGSRSWIGSLGLLCGAGAGGLIYLLIGGIGGSFDPMIAGIAGLVGSGTGLGLGLWLSETVDGDTSFGDGVTVSANLAPTNGGAMATIDGRF